MVFKRLLRWFLGERTGVEAGMDWARAPDAMDLVGAGTQGEVTSAVQLPESQDPSQGAPKGPCLPCVPPQAQRRPPKLQRRLCVQSGLAFVIKLICM